MSEPSPDRHRPALLPFVAALCLGWCLLAALSLMASQPTTALSLGAVDSARPYVTGILPQGWGFFTKSPRDEQFYLFVKGPDGAWVPGLRGPLSAPGNFLGLDRFVRAQSIEFGLLVSSLGTDAWTACRGLLDACVRTAKVGVSLTNPSPHRLICGPVAFVMRKQVPWAWTRSKRPVQMPYRLALVEVQC
ncbi:SdpA family antimicrobial peptide system protein [Calidithermus chliarophilus]|uniref:SdpA family antimicrobial peptide system protein n=1 Tax=Calidithermus chliarophilus TaxID=52023 RepID=UPI0009FCB56E